jgi:hypothetical protein
VSALRNWGDSDLPFDVLLGLSDDPFASFDEVERFTSGGRPWVCFAHASSEYCVDVEVTDDRLRRSSRSIPSSLTVARV